MVYQLKAKTDKEYVFDEESSTNFFSYKLVVKNQ